jgi:DNA (cytosine-5)-methyltransferase 1
VVGALAGTEFDVPQNGWQNTGVATGPKGLVEWSVLDAQWFGVPQRRRRVFLVRDSGDWRSRPPILFIAESLRGHPPPSREAGEGVAGTTGPLTSCGGTERKHGFGWRQQEWESGYAVTHSLRAEGFDASEDGTGRGTPLVAFDSKQSGEGEPAPTVDAAHVDAVAYQCHGSNVGEMGHLRAGHGDVQSGVPFTVFSHNGCAKERHAKEAGVSAAVDSCGGYSPGQGGTLVGGMAVRRLTPTECARLQGFPDSYLSQVTYRGKCPPADGPMYRALGNSMAVPVMRWIGRRIMEAQCET